MKKISVLLLMAATCLTINTKAQKSGILQKDHYGDFTGDQWENFLAGKNATDFQAKSNVDLQPYLDIMVTPFVKQELKEQSINDAVGNSTVTTIPAGATVYTIQTDGTWKNRTAYIGKDGKGEKGFLHNPTGIFWLSFECGNLVNNKFFGTPSKATPGAQTVGYTPPGNTGAGNTTAGTSNTVNVTTGGTNQQELSWNTGYAVYSLGRNDRQNDFIVDASLFKLIQDAKQCCGGGGSTVAAATVSYAAPTVYAQPSITAAPAQNAGYATNSTLTVINKANGWDKVNTIANVGSFLLNGYNTINGQKVYMKSVNTGYSNTQNWNGGYYNNTNPSDFQGSSILGQTFTGGTATNLNSIGQTYTAQQINTSNGNGGYNNTQIF